MGRAIRTVFDLACEYGRIKASAAELPELYPDSEAELRVLVSNHCLLLREYRQTAGLSTGDFCASTGLSVEVLYLVEGGDLDGVALADVEAVLDTYASGSCS